MTAGRLPYSSTMNNERMRRLAFWVLCINITLVLLGLLFAWSAQRAAAKPPDIPTSLAGIIATDPASPRGQATCVRA